LALNLIRSNQAVRALFDHRLEERGAEGRLSAAFGTTAAENLLLGPHPTPLRPDPHPATSKGE
jgi:hypothetical protein